ncbi:unnamed protein product [Amoebophrya sp. A120]|nr:unnamed protein product [Amoebophrya sp. A120]|eukprot:GSA120T00024958001.1
MSKCSGCANCFQGYLRLPFRRTMLQLKEKMLDDRLKMIVGEIFTRNGVDPDGLARDLPDSVFDGLLWEFCSEVLLKLVLNYFGYNPKLLVRCEPDCVSRLPGVAVWRFANITKENHHAIVFVEMPGRVRVRDVEIVVELFPKLESRPGPSGLPDDVKQILDGYDSDMRDDPFRRLYAACEDMAFRRHPGLLFLLGVAGEAAYGEFPAGDPDQAEFWVGSHTLDTFVERTGCTRVQELETIDYSLTVRHKRTGEPRCRFSSRRKTVLVMDGVRFPVRVVEAVSPAECLEIHSMPFVQNPGRPRGAVDVEFGSYAHARYGVVNSFCPSVLPVSAEFARYPKRCGLGVRRYALRDFLDDAPSHPDTPANAPSTSHDVPTLLTPSLPGATMSSSSRLKATPGRRRRNLNANLAWARRTLRTNGAYYWLAVNATRGRYQEWSSGVPDIFAMATRSGAVRRDQLVKHADMAEILTFVGNMQEHLDEPENGAAKEVLRKWAVGYKGGKFYDEDRFEVTAGELFPLFFVDKVCPKTHELWSDYTNVTRQWKRMRDNKALRSLKVDYKSGSSELHRLLQADWDLWDTDYPQAIAFFRNLPEDPQCRRDVLEWKDGSGLTAVDSIEADWRGDLEQTLWNAVGEAENSSSDAAAVSGG